MFSFYLLKTQHVLACPKSQIMLQMEIIRRMYRLSTAHAFNSIAKESQSTLDFESY
jgi:hypothetical protein